MKQRMICTDKVKVGLEFVRRAGKFLEAIHLNMAKAGDDGCDSHVSRYDSAEWNTSELSSEFSRNCPMCVL